MKVNIEIDCTPVEARQFFGLPNVEPIQAAVMQQLELLPILGPPCWYFSSIS